MGRLWRASPELQPDVLARDRRCKGRLHQTLPVDARQEHHKAPLSCCCPGSQVRAETRVLTLRAIRGVVDCSQRRVVVVQWVRIMLRCRMTCFRNSPNTYLASSTSRPPTVNFQTRQTLGRAIDLTERCTGNHAPAGCNSNIAPRDWTDPQ